MIAAKEKKEEFLKLYRTMLTIRRFEERTAEDYKKRLPKPDIYGNDRILPGLVHSYIGEEASATGICSALTRDDKIVSNHRGHGHCIAKGADIKRMYAELYGRITGYCKGKGGSMHIADFSIGMLGANGIVGGGFGIATGAALAAKLEGKGRVAVVFFGDGASQEGTFHENMNLASIWKLPLIFACENNLYAVDTHVSYAVPVKNIADRAAAYAMPSVVVDGNDVIAVSEVAHEVVARARQGLGPYFVELKTYRWHTHSEWHLDTPDPRPLRPLEEIESWKKKDPITSLERRLIEGEIASKEELMSIDQQIIVEIGNAVKFAADSPMPKAKDAMADVFSEREAKI